MTTRRGVRSHTGYCARHPPWIDPSPTRPHSRSNTAHEKKTENTSLPLDYGIWPLLNNTGGPAIDWVDGWTKEFTKEEKRLWPCLWWSPTVENDSCPGPGHNLSVPSSYHTWENPLIPKPLFPVTWVSPSSMSWIFWYTGAWYCQLLADGVPRRELRWEARRRALF